MPMIDPMSVPYMQQAFGGGQLTEHDMKNMMMMGGMLGGGMGGMGNRGMGLGSAQPAQIAQGPAPIQHGSSGSGPNQGLMAGGNDLASGGGASSAIAAMAGK